MSDAELRHDADLLTAASRRLGYVPRVLMPAAVGLLGCLALGLIVGTGALGFPLIASLGVMLALEGVAIPATMEAAGSCHDAIDKRQDEYRKRLEKIDGEQKRRAARSPVLVAMVKATHEAKTGWKRNVLSAAAQKVFQDGTDRVVTVRRPLKLTATP